MNQAILQGTTDKEESAQESANWFTAFSWAVDRHMRKSMGSHSRKNIWYSALCSKRRKARSISRIQDTALSQAERKGPKLLSLDYLL